MIQVVNREKKFVPATPIQGTILVNIADLMQRWTADKLVSTVNICSWLTCNYNTLVSPLSSQLLAYMICKE